MKKLLSFLFIISLVFIYSCDKDDPVTPEGPLNAKAGPNQDAEVNETVTLDGSESTGPSGFTYLWTYEGDVPEADIDFQNINSAKSTFIPPAQGYYEFTLKVSHGDSSNVDETSVLVGGAIELGGTLTEDLALKNVQKDGDLPDYIVISDLVVPDGLKLSIIEDDVIVEFQSGTGIHVQEGGLFTNVNEEDAYGYTSELTGTSGWKGILINSGTLNLERALIINAGKTAFDGQAEAAAISFVGNLSTLESLSDNEFVNSNSYDILAIDRVVGPEFPIKRNKLSFSIPIKAQIKFMELWTSDHPNIMPDEYDYIQLAPSGSERRDVIDNPNGFSFFPQGTKYYIDGDFWAGSDILVGDNCIIYMKENSGILVDTQWRSHSGSLITGLNGKTWNGIATSKGASGIKVLGSTIENAGYGNIEIGQVLAEAPTAIYWSDPDKPGISEISNSTIKNSGGYGFYDATNTITFATIENTTFQNIAMAAIKTNMSSVNQAINEDHGNVFDLASGIPAVIVTGDGRPDRGNWYSLGENNYYLIDGVINPSSFEWLTFNAGVILKFKSDRYFDWSGGSMLRINGTDTDPVIFDGESGTSGSWGGLYLSRDFQIDNLIIKNGGGFMLPNATEKANIISNHTDLATAPQQYIKNSTISDSAGWGIVVESGSYDFQFDEAAKNNTFSNNVSGDINVK